MLKKNLALTSNISTDNNICIHFEYGVNAYAGLQIIFFTWKDICPTTVRHHLVRTKQNCGRTSPKTKGWILFPWNYRAITFLTICLHFCYLLLSTVKYTTLRPFSWGSLTKKYQPRKKKQSVCIPVVFTRYYCRGRKIWAILLYYWSLKISF